MSETSATFLWKLYSCIMYSIQLCWLTNKKAAVGHRGTVLPLKKFVEEGGKSSDYGGETALGQNQQHEDRSLQQPNELLGEHCKNTIPI